MKFFVFLKTEEGSRKHCYTWFVLSLAAVTESAGPGFTAHISPVTLEPTYQIGVSGLVSFETKGVLEGS